MKNKIVESEIYKKIKDSEILSKILKYIKIVLVSIWVFVKKASKEIWKVTKKVSKEIWKVTKKVSKEIWKVTKIVAKEAARLFKYLSQYDWFVAVLGVLSAILLGMIILAIAGDGFLTLLNGMGKATFASASSFTSWMMTSSLLLLTGLSVAFAYKSGLFNIGAEGQFIVGMLASGTTAIVLDLNGFSLVICSVLAGTIAGAIFGYIPGYLKAYYGVSEVVVTIMLNWIAIKSYNFFITDVITSETTSARSQAIPEAARLTFPDLSEKIGTNLHWGIIIALVCLFVYWIILSKSKAGYEIKAVGYNPIASRNAGIKEKKVTIRAFMISGIFASLAGTIYALGEVEYLSQMSSFLNYGFDGMTVAFLGQMNTIGLMLSSLLVGVLRETGAQIPGVPREIIDIIIAIVLLSVIIGPKIRDSKMGGKK